MPQEFTFEELQKMGAKPAEFSFEELSSMQQPTQPPQDGFWKSTGKEVVRSLAQTGARALTSSPLSPLQKLDPTGIITKKILPEKVKTPVGEVSIRTLDNPMKELGAMLEDFSNVYGGEGLGSIGKATLKTLVKQGFKTGLKEGAVVGSSATLGRGLQEDKSPWRVAGETLLGAAGGAVLGGTIGTVAPLIGKGFKAVFEPIESKVKAKLTEAVDKGIKPYFSSNKTPEMMKKYSDKAIEAFKIIKQKAPAILDEETGEKIVRSPTTRKEMLEALSEAKRQIYGEYHDVAQEAGGAGAQYNPAGILSKLDEVIASKKYNPTIRKYANEVKNEISELAGESPEVIEIRIQDLNSSLAGFYEGRINKAKAQIDATVAGIMRNDLDSLIERTTGKEYQVLKNQYGALKTIEKDLARQVVIEARKNVKALGESITDVFTGADLLVGAFTGNPAQFLRGAIGKTIMSRIKSLNDPNRYIKAGFDVLNKLPAEVKINKVKPKIAGILPAPAMRMPEKTGSTIQKEVNASGIIKNAPLPTVLPQEARPGQRLLSAKATPERIITPPPTTYEPKARIIGNTKTRDDYAIRSIKDIQQEADFNAGKSKIIDGSEPNFFEFPSNQMESQYQDTVSLLKDKRLSNPKIKEAVLSGDGEAFKKELVNRKIADPEFINDLLYSQEKTDNEVFDFFVKRIKQEYPELLASKKIASNLGLTKTLNTKPLSKTNSGNVVERTLTTKPPTKARTLEGFSNPAVGQTVDNPLTQGAKKYKSAEEFVGERLYALNKKSKGEGVVGKEITPGEEIFSIEGDKKLYELKNKVIEKLGLPTGKIHRFPGAGIGIEYKIGDFSFHKFGKYAYSFIDDTNKKIIERIKPEFEVLKRKFGVKGDVELVGGGPYDRMYESIIIKPSQIPDNQIFVKEVSELIKKQKDAFSYKNADNAEEIPRISEKLKEGVSRLNDKDLELLEKIADGSITKSQLTDIWNKANVVNNKGKAAIGSVIGGGVGAATVATVAPSLVKDRTLESPVKIERTLEAPKAPKEFSATYYDPLDPNQTKNNPDGIGAFNKPVKFGDIAMGKRIYKQGDLVFIEELKDIKTPYGDGVFKVNDKKNKRYNTESDSFDIALPGSKTKNKEKYKKLIQRIGNNKMHFKLINR